MILFFFILTGCDSHNSQTGGSIMSAPSTSKSQQANGTPFVGRVVFMDLEGGFWGVITDSGKKLNGGVPAKLRFEQQQVRGTYLVKRGMASTQMWGELVDFTLLEPIGPIIKSSKNEM